MLFNLYMFLFLMSNLSNNIINNAVVQAILLPKDITIDNLVNQKKQKINAPHFIFGLSAKPSDKEINLCKIDYIFCNWLINIYYSKLVI